MEEISFDWKIFYFFFERTTGCQILFFMVRFLNTTRVVNSIIKTITPGLDVAWPLFAHAIVLIGWFV